MSILRFKQNVKTSQAIQILSAHGLYVTEKQARVMVKFLYKLAASNIQNEKSIFIHQG